MVINIEYEKFYGKLRKVADSVVITIPFNIIKFGGYEKGDEVIVMIKKSNIDIKK